MVVRIDTDEMIISFDGEMNIKEFIDGIKAMLPKGGWKDYLLKSKDIDTDNFYDVNYSYRINGDDSTSFAYNKKPESDENTD